MRWALSQPLVIKKMTYSWILGGISQLRFSLSDYSSLCQVYIKLAGTESS